MICASLATHPRAHALRWLPASRVPTARSLTKLPASSRQQPRNAFSTLIVRAASDGASTEVDTTATPLAPETPSSSSSSSSQVPAPADNILYATKLAAAVSPPSLEAFKAHVEPYTGVQDVMLFENRTPAGHPKHVGYIIFDTPENAEAAQQKLHKSQFSGSLITVKTHKREPQSANSQVPTQVTDDPNTPSQKPKSQNRRRGNPYARANYVRVNNLAWATMNEDLSEHFKGSEGMQDAFITYNRDERPSGVGYVKFETEEEAAAAVQALQGSVLDERDLKLRQMQPAWAERSPTAAETATSGEEAALKGASDSETPVFVKQVPPTFTWREVLGMCSVFGEVKRVQILNRAKNNASKAAALAEGSGAVVESSEGEQKQKLVPAAIVFMTSRDAAEKVIGALNGLEVQGSKLRVNVYRGQREKGQSAPAVAAAVAVADADVSKGSE